MQQSVDPRVSRHRILAHFASITALILVFYHCNLSIQNSCLRAKGLTVNTEVFSDSNNFTNELLLVNGDGGL